MMAAPFGVDRIDVLQDPTRVEQWAAGVKTRDRTEWGVADEEEMA